MLVLLSPAKSINADVEDTTVSLSIPGFDTDTAELLETLQSYSEAVLQQTLGVSPALARQAAQRSVSKCNFNRTILAACAASTMYAISLGLSKTARQLAMRSMVLHTRHWT